MSQRDVFSSQYHQNDINVNSSVPVCQLLLCFSLVNTPSLKNTVCSLRSSAQINKPAARGGGPDGGIN